MGKRDFITIVIFFGIIFLLSAFTVRRIANASLGGSGALGTEPR